MTTTTTTTQASRTIPGTEDQHRFTVHTAVPDLTAESSTATASSSSTSSATTTTTVEDTTTTVTEEEEEENVHVVLPVGWSTKPATPGTTKPPRRFRTQSHPFSTQRTTTTAAVTTTVGAFSERNTTQGDLPTTTENSTHPTPQFTSLRDRIRQRLRAGDKANKKESTFDVLKAINSKTLAEAKAAKEREAKAREEARKALAAKEALMEKLRAKTSEATTTEEDDTTEEATASYELTTLTPVIEVKSLVDRRKELFLKRTTTRRPVAQKGKTAVLSAEQVHTKLFN